MHTSQNSQSSSNCLYQTDPRLVLDSSDSRASIGTIPYNSHVQNVTFQWRASAMDQCPFPEPSAPNELTVPSWSKIREDNLVTKHHFMAPTMPHIELPGTEALRDRSGIPSLTIPIASEGLEESTSESPSQAGSLSPSEQCYTLWKQIPVDAIVVTGPNKFVPQRLYRPFTEADKERYLERVSLSAPIIFVTKEPFEWGISLEDVRNGKTRHLVDKEVAVLQDCGPSVSIRINWPGYASFKRQISSRNWRKTKGPITKEKLAQNLAKTTYRFIEKMSNKPLEVGADKSWKVGPQHIKVEDLILVSLHQVSKGSWQPQFRLRRDFVT
ncbi:hypothetical protein OG21DRAFT_1456949 [Imleria badia]|nr:hypothetical protein OG21DRAFT_1456949 [Imleria badia]